MPAATPEQAFEARRAAWLAADGRAIWNTLSAKTRRDSAAKQESQIASLKAMSDRQLAAACEKYGLTVPQFRRMNVEDFAAHVISLVARQNVELAHRFRETRFLRAEIAGTRATCTLRTPSGTEERLVFVAEGGEWRVDDDATDEANGRGE